MRLLRTTGLCALLLGAGACADLTVPNNNQPDQARVVADPGDVETLVANSFNTAFLGYTYQTDLVLSTAAFEHSAMAANLGMIQLSKIPREPINNQTSDAYSPTYEEVWYRSYAAIKSAVDALNATNPGNPDFLKIENPITGEDRTPRARAWGRFVQGLAHGNLALTYDQAFVYDQGDDPLNLQLQPYKEVMVEALAMLDSAVAITNANTFTIPSTWFGNRAGGLTKAEFLQVINGYQAYMRAGVARSPAERAAVNWAAVIADVDASLTCTGATCEIITIKQDVTVWPHRTHQFIGFGVAVPNWAQVNYMIHGMADQSGGYQAWLAKPVLSRTPFLVITPDKRFPQGADATAQATAAGKGKYIEYGGARGHVRSDRGTWRWSLYRDNRLDALAGTKGDSPILHGRDLRLLKAEGLFRTGNLAGAAAIVNETRMPNGLNETNAAGLNTSCVPKLPSGACGGLFEMLKWEKRMENYHYSYGSWYFDSRGWGDLYKGTFLHLPVPARELQVLKMPLYTFGGPEVGYDKGSAPGSSYGWPGE